MLRTIDDVEEDLKKVTKQRDLARRLIADFVEAQAPIGSFPTIAEMNKQDAAFKSLVYFHNHVNDVEDDDD